MLLVLVIERELAVVLLLDDQVVPVALLKLVPVVEIAGDDGGVKEPMLSLSFRLSHADDFGDLGPALGASVETRKDGLTLDAAPLIRKPPPIISDIPSIFTS